MKSTYDAFVTGRTSTSNARTGRTCRSNSLSQPTAPAWRSAPSTASPAGTATDAGVTATPLDASEIGYRVSDIGYRVSDIARSSRGGAAARFDAYGMRCHMYRSV